MMTSLFDQIQNVNICWPAYYHYSPIAIFVDTNLNVNSNKQTPSNVLIFEKQKKPDPRQESEIESKFLMRQTGFPIITDILLM